MTDSDRIAMDVFPGANAPEACLSAAEARALRRASTPVVVTCSCCGSDLLHPLEWEKTGQGWLVTVRCPECRSEQAVAFDRRSMERFVAQLHGQKRALARDLARLSLGRFSAEAQGFIRALRAGHILPTDF